MSLNSWNLFGCRGMYGVDFILNGNLIKEINDIGVCFMRATYEKPMEKKYVFQEKGITDVRLLYRFTENYDNRIRTYLYLPKAKQASSVLFPVDFFEDLVFCNKDGLQLSADIVGYDLWRETNSWVIDIYLNYYDGAILANAQFNLSLDYYLVEGFTFDILEVGVGRSVFQILDLFDLNKLFSVKHKIFLEGNVSVPYERFVPRCEFGWKGLFK